MLKKSGASTSSRWHSVRAILAGFVFVIILSLGTDAVLHAIGLFPPLGQSMRDGLFLLATAYRIAYGIFGSYVTARLAPNRPMWHAMTGGVIGLFLSIAGAVATWNRMPTLGPHWYPVALVVTALPCSWIGAKLRILQMQAN